MSLADEKTLEAPHTICFSHYNDQTQKEIDTFANEHDMQLINRFDKIIHIIKFHSVTFSVLLSMK